MLNWIDLTRPQGSVRNSVTVVFDGKDGFFSSHGSASVKVIFSKGQSADDLIKEIVERSPLKKNWVVVSNDKEIKLYVRALGAQVLPVKEFVSTGMDKEKKSIKRKSDAVGKYLSLTQQVKINQELEQIWIKLIEVPQPMGPLMGQEGKSHL